MYAHRIPTATALLALAVLLCSCGSTPEAASRNPTESSVTASSAEPSIPPTETVAPATQTFGPPTQTVVPPTETFLPETKPTENHEISLNNGGTLIPRVPPGVRLVLTTTVNVKNNSPRPMVIGAVELVGDPSFSISNEPCQGTLPPSQTCSISVVWVNPGPGKYSAELTVHLPSDNSYKSMRLHQTGSSITTATPTTPPPPPPTSPSSSP